MNGFTFLRDLLEDHPTIRFPTLWRLHKRYLALKGEEEIRDRSRRILISDEEAWVLKEVLRLMDQGVRPSKALIMALSSSTGKAPKAASPTGEIPQPHSSPPPPWEELLQELRGIRQTLQDLVKAVQAIGGPSRPRRIRVNAPPPGPPPPSLEDIARNLKGE